MSTKIHLSGLPSFWTDTNLHQTLAPFGTVVSAQIVRDLFGHSLGLAVVHLCLPISKSAVPGGQAAVMPPI